MSCQLEGKLSLQKGGIDMITEANEMSHMRIDDLSPEFYQIGAV